MLDIYSSESYQDFFTDADELKLLMVELLGDVTGKKLLEPCVGAGAFVRSLIGAPELVHGIDIDKKHLDVAADITNKNLYLQEGDFINHFVLDDLFGSLEIRSDYDAIICNPPYGLKFSTDYRKQIKKRFPHLYARESYGLFFYFGLLCLKEGGRYVFIVPDTFLTSRNHRPLREFIVNSAKPTHIIQFDSSRFESVNYGYGSMCIISGFKGGVSEGEMFKWIDARKTSKPLTIDYINDSSFERSEYLVERVKDGWVSPAIESTLQLAVPHVKLEEIAECRTGIYTGKNEEYCGFDARTPTKRANGRPIAWDESVHQGELSVAQKKNGIADGKHYVSFVRGGHRQPFEDTSWAINWSVKSVQFYKDDKKARFQNADFYFEPGLAVPMVTSGRITASLISNSVFDQGVVGIFPKDKKHINFLLIYLNSDFATDLKNAIHPGANNSANYIKRIPVPILDEHSIKHSDDIVSRSKLNGWESTAEEREEFLGAVLNGGSLP